jgi:predicted nucleic acid-binding protein
MDLYDCFFNSSEVVILELTKEVVDRAANLRAFGKLKTPDARHVATAMLARVDVFLTGDKELEAVSVPEIRR